MANSKDQTAFLAVTLLTVLGLSGFTHALGLSDTLGAFLAGVLLAETKFRFQVACLSLCNALWNALCNALWNALCNALRRSLPGRR